ncbi:MAG: hypothetical protein Kow0069_20230 [Promethearchaeota archaeon]
MSDKRASARGEPAVYFLSFAGDVVVGLTALATSLLSVVTGASPLQVGVVGAGYGLSYCFAPALLGRFGDPPVAGGRHFSLGRKGALIVATLGFLAVHAYLLVLATSWVQGFVGNVLAGVAGGTFWPNASALAADVGGAGESSLTANGAHGHSGADRVVANFCAAWSVGYALGPFLSGALAEASVSLAFLLALAFDAVILSSVASVHVREVHGEVPNGSDYLADQVVPRTTTGKRWPFIVTSSFLFAFNNQTFVALFPVYALQPRPTGLGVTSTFVGVLLLFVGVGRTATFLLAGRTPRRLRQPVLFGSLACASASLGAFALLENRLALLVVASAFGAASGFLFTSALYLALEVPAKRGHDAGVLESLVGVGFSSSSLLGGWLVEASGKPNSPWILGSFVTLACFLALLATRRTASRSHNFRGASRT